MMCTLCMGDKFIRPFKREELNLNIQLAFPTLETIYICKKCGWSSANINYIPPEEVVMGAVIEYPAPQKNKTKEELLKNKEDWMDGD